MKSGVNMGLPSVLDVISKASPLIAAAISGPYGEIIESVVKSFFGNEKNPDELKKNIDVDKTYQDKIASVEVLIKDMQNARQDHHKSVSFARKILNYFIIIVFLTDMALLCLVIDPYVREILAVILGMCIFEIKQVFKFYYGWSEDDEKTKIG